LDGCQKKITQQTVPYLILFLSGFAGLGYEMVRTRMLAVGLGHEIIAVLAVVSAFFCGMALGAWRLDGVVSRSHGGVVRRPRADHRELDVLRTIIRTFMQVFPNGNGVLATYSLQTPTIGLIAPNDKTLYRTNYMAKKAVGDQLRRKLAALRLSNTYTLFGTFIAAPMI
jgi:hypothetical protein